jgi:hypothetical protein
MSEDKGSLEIGDSNKLEGLANYYIWSLKMCTVLRGENIWDFTERKITPASYPVTIGGKQKTKAPLKKKKAQVLKAFI